MNVEDNEKPIIKEGWGESHNGKWHYFIVRDGYRFADSLCRKIGFYPTDNLLELGNDNSPDNCAKCKRELLKLKQTEVPNSSRC